MERSLPRRRYLGGLCAFAALGTAGCTQALPNSDGDLLIANRDGERHSVTVIMDRGSAYTPKVESARVGADAETRLGNVFEQSDWPYPFLLHVYVDGEYVRTTEHRWDSEIRVTIERGGNVTAEPPEPEDVPVDITPQVRNETTRG